MSIFDKTQIRKQKNVLIEIPIKEKCVIVRLIAMYSYNIGLKLIYDNRKNIFKRLSILDFEHSEEFMGLIINNNMYSFFVFIIVYTFRVEECE